MEGPASAPANAPDKECVTVLLSHDVERFRHLVESDLDLTVRSLSDTTRHVTVVGPGARSKVLACAKRMPPGYVTVVQ